MSIVRSVLSPNLYPHNIIFAFVIELVFINKIWSYFNIILLLENLQSIPMLYIYSGTDLEMEKRELYLPTYRKAKSVNLVFR